MSVLGTFNFLFQIECPFHDLDLVNKQDTQLGIV